MTSVICAILNLAWLGLLAWIILSYVVNFGKLPWGHPIRKIYDAMSNVINPILMPIRRMLPPVRAGSMGLDLSPMVLFLIIIVLQRIVC
ncbi:MAG: YggT family protein [bacterium]|nr:YggT family protein [bacterium]MCP4965095.1 YggT family protein [bacterium]